MAKRSITDFEISLIKKMLTKGMANNDIQFYFNRPGRPVNSGRITGIKNGEYSNSSKIMEASDSALEEFIEVWKEQNDRNYNKLKKYEAQDISNGDFTKLRTVLDRFVGHDCAKVGNYQELPITQAELNIVKKSIELAEDISELPSWSTSTINFLKGVQAVLRELTETLNEAGTTIKGALIPLLKLVNAVIAKIQTCLEALKVDFDGEEK